MYHLIKKCIVITAALLVMWVVPRALPAQDGGGGGDNLFGIVLQAGAGYKETMFGFIGGSDSSSDLGTGPGGGYDVSAMFNISIAAVKFGYSYSAFDTMEWNETVSGVEHSYKSYGDGHYSTLDILLGLKVFKESDDMGYTYFFGGFRSWEAIRNVDYREVDGVRVSDSGSNIELAGSGWIAGFQDFSTYPVAFFSIVLQTGFTFSQAPFDSLKSGDAEIETNNEATLGLGFNIGLGVAFEDIGLSAVAGYRTDVNATSFELSILPDETYVAGAGYGLFFFSITKDLGF